MLRKIISTALGIISLNCAFAGNAYFAFTPTFQDITSGDIEYSGVEPRAALGYSMTSRDCYYLGLEAFIGPKSFFVYNKPSTVASLKTSYNYGASLLPGYFFDEVVWAYLRIGGIQTKFSDLNVTKAGFQYGAGLEAVLDHVWSVRGEYDRTVYNSINGITTPKAYEVGAGLVYRFS